MESNLGSTSPHETRKLDTSTKLPLGKFLLGNSVGVLAGIETADEAGALGGTAANVEAPGDEGAVLVGVESNSRVGHESNAVLGNL